jgi:hypothetical protein
LRRVVTERDVAELERALAEELPGFAVAYKDESRLQQWIGVAVRPFNTSYMRNYTTVMGGKVFFPSRAWRARVGPRTIYETLRHEAVHLRDMRRFWGFFHVSYVLLLPAGLTFRAWWEWRAYAESLRVQAELDGCIDDASLRFIEECFTGPDYLYMLPLRGFVRRRLAALRDEILAEQS